MSNKPQAPPSATVWPLGMARPTSPPPPRKKGPVDPLESAYAMIRDLRAAVQTGDERRDRLTKQNDDLQRQIRELRCELGKHECPSCGERDIVKHRYFNEQEEPMCSACGGTWE